MGHRDFKCGRWPWAWFSRMQDAALSTLEWPGALAVASGAAVGALARWRLGVWLSSAPVAFPLGTLVVNLVGGFLIGMALAGMSRSTWLHLFVVTGVLGGFTTFSAFSAESLSLLQRGQWGVAALHALAHVIGALVCTGLGFALVRSLVRA